MNPKPPSIWQRGILPGISPFRFVLWFFRWRNVRRILFVLACLATLVAVFYAEENWRGRHAWEKFKREQEAKGESLDWRAFVPPPVPDDQNFAMAPFWEETRYEWDARKKGIDRNPDTNQVDRFIRRQMSAYRVGGPKPPPASSCMESTKADLKAWQAYYRAPAGTNKFGKPIDHPANVFPIPPVPGDPAADVLLALGKYDEALNELRSASQRPFSRFPINYEDNAGALLPHVGRMKGCTLYLLARITAELAMDRSGEAAQDMELMFYLCDSIKSEPWEISHVVRAWLMQNPDLSAIWEGMADHQWSADQLRTIQARLESENFLADFQRALKAEAAFVSPMIDEFASSRLTAYAKVFEGASPPQSLRWYLRFAPRGWLEEERVWYARLQLDAALVMDPSAQRVEFKKLADLEPDFQVFETHAVLSKYMSEWLLLSTSDDETQYRSGIYSSVAANMVRLAVRVQTSVNLGVVACGLERYWLANKVYPEKLDGLVPQFIAKLPHEIVSGEPLKYRRTDDGRFILYSTGIDGRDSGGRYRTPDGKLTGNWVWRYPPK